MIEEKVVDYIKKKFGLQPELENYSRIKSLPLHLRSRYKLTTLNLLNRTFLLVNPHDESDIKPARINKQLNIFKEITGLEPVIILSRITAVLRKWFIQYKIAFIVPENHLYIPALMLELKDFFPRKSNNTIKKVLPATQVVLLSDMYNKLPRPVTAVELGDLFGYTKMTMSRVVDELERLGIAVVEKKGKNKFTFIELENKVLWDKIADNLRTPVSKKIYVKIQFNDIYTKLLKAGLTALSEVTMLADGDKPVFATSRKVFAEMQRSKQITTVDNDFEADAQLEIWNYDPAVLYTQNKVDELSLYLSLRNEQDERIQLAIKELIENFKWK
jgi:DNA-binding MarR family transcriptional regulator